MSGSGSGGTSNDLLRHLHYVDGDDDGAETICRSMCHELTTKAASCAEQEACTLMVSLQNALSDGPCQQIETLLDRCALDLCAPVIISGALGLECCHAATGLLKTIAAGSPARDMYTGAGDKECT